MVMIMIKQITIENFKSIKYANFKFKDNHDIVCLIGKNGSGKSNVFKAIKYFFDNISRPYSEAKIIDNSNPYIQKCKISIIFDLKLLYEKSKHNTELRKKFDKIDYYIENHFENSNPNWEISLKKELELSMTQFKDGAISWNIDNNNIRETIKLLFPIYYIDTRKLDIFTWEQLWQIISDLSATMPQISQEECRDLIDFTFTEIYGNKYTLSKEKIEVAFKKNIISLDPYHFDSKYKNAFAMRFGGEQFLVDKHPLSYFSDGTNSYNYLILLTTLIPQISDISCKHPLILLDEPETGLHSEYISKFVNTIFNNLKNNSLMLISTHSSKLISEFTNHLINFQLYKINRIGANSEIFKMNTSWLTDNSHRITIKETECYFYDYLVYIEGETEVELFENKYIRSIFKKIEQIHFYSFDSNDERLKAVNSKNINLGVKYKLIVDSDKIISYNNKTLKFKLYHGINPLYNKENKQKNAFRFFNSSSDDLISAYNNIISMLKSTYSYSPNSHYIKSQNFNILMQNIKKICNYYNVIVNWSTIEGELITYENIDKFLEFVETQSIPQNVKNQHSNIKNITDSKEKAILVLCEYLGKTETQQQKDGVKFNNKSLKPLTTKKTNGWVQLWIKYYFKNYIDTFSTETEKRAQFRKDFPSLYNTLQELENMVE